MDEADIDLEEYVQTAKSLGMKGILYENLPPLRKELIKLGVSIS